MAEAFIGEIRLLPYTYAPKFWAWCNGQIIQINQNQALYSLLGTTFGGDGINTFGLPDLRGRIPLHVGSGQGLTPRSWGQKGGSEQVVLTESQIPSHTHPLQGTTAAGNSNLPQNNIVANNSENNYQNALTNPVAMSNQVLGSSGGNQGHENRQPFLGLNYCICLQGYFPSRD